MHPRTPSISRTLAILTASLALPIPSTVRADVLTNYTVQAIARIGDRVGAGEFTNGFGVGQFNDNGQLAFETNLGGASAVVRYSDGKFTPIAMAGETAPDGQ